MTLGALHRITALNPGSMSTRAAPRTEVEQPSKAEPGGFKASVHQESDDCAPASEVPSDLATSSRGAGLVLLVSHMQLCS